MSDRHPNYTIPWARVRVSAGDKPGTMRLTEFGLATYDGSRWTLADLEPRTWAQLRAIPTALLTPGMVCRVTDYAYQQWVWGGAFWRPAQGRAVIASNVTPSVVTGAADMMFTLATAAKKIPAGMVFPGSRLIGSADFIKSGANGTFTPYVRIGTTDSYGDTAIFGIGHTNTNNLLVRASGHILVGLDGSFIYTTGTVVSPGSGTQFAQSAANFDVNADMFMSVHIRTANAAD